jgi:hypothetical protein
MILFHFFLAWIYCLELYNESEKINFLSQKINTRDKILVDMIKNINYNDNNNLNNIIKIIYLFNSNKIYIKLDSLQMKKYLQTSIKNMANNIEEIIYIILKYIGEIESIIEMFEFNLKNYIFGSNYDKANELYIKMKTINNNLKLDKYTYDFKKYFESILINYDFEKYKEKFNKKLLIFDKETIINKYDDDDIYKDENNTITKILKNFDKTNYISKENSWLLLEITKNNEQKKIKLNLNQYMILDSVLNNNIIDVDTLKKAYGNNNIIKLKEMNLIKIEDNKVINLCS